MSHAATNILTPRSLSDARTSSAPVARKPTGWRPDESDRASDPGAPAAAPFNSLLNTLQASRRSQRMLVGGQASPQEMFEPRASDVHQRRLEMLRTEDRAALDRQLRPETADQPKTTTGQSPGPSDRAKQQPWMRNQPAIASNDPNPANQELNGRGHLESDWRTQVRSRPQGSPDPSSRTAQASSESSAADALSTPAPSATSPLSLGSANFQSAAITASGAGPPNSDSNAAAPNPAEQVGRILSAGKASDTGLSRPPADPTMTRGEPRPPPRFTGTPSGATTLDSEPPASPDVETVPRSPFDALVRAIRLNPGAQYSSARLWLEPPELGRMQVDVRVHGRQVRIGVRTETAAARRIVSERAAELTEALERHGVTIEDFEVVAATPDESATDAAHSGRATPLGRWGRIDRAAGGSESHRGALPSGQSKAGKVTESLVVAAEPRLDVRA